jgi:hypothetical protein
MLNVVFIECYVACHYPECHTECRGSVRSGWLTKWKASGARTFCQSVIQLKWHFGNPKKCISIWEGI